jgi:hypothetical protein
VAGEVQWEAQQRDVSTSCVMVGLQAGIRRRDFASIDWQVISRVHQASGH